MNIFITSSRDGNQVFFCAQSWGDARLKATDLAGKRYRFILAIPEWHHLYRPAIHALGLTN